MPEIVLCLCGDVMTGRGIDQILPHPGDPQLYEPLVSSAAQYVGLAEAANGRIDKPVGFTYIWGDALIELEKADACVVNLETSVTTSRDRWPKEVHYKMNPANVPCLSQAGIDCCSLANNHSMDFGTAGLLESVDALRQTGIAVAGAGRDAAQAADAAVKEVRGKGRVVVFAFASTTSGVPPEWAATPWKPGLNLLADLSERTIRAVAAAVRAFKRSGDVVVASIHWGSNWGYEIPAAQTLFAHRLIEVAGVDVVYGHSSHHVKAIEIYEGKLILYGCGDFIDDYEGIAGYERFRDDLALMFLATVEASNGRLARLVIRPFQIRRMHLSRAARCDTEWLCEVLNRESREFEARFRITGEESIELA